MNFFEMEKSTATPPTQTSVAPASPFHSLHQTLTSLQTHFSNLLHNFQTNPPLRNPLFAKISNENKPLDVNPISSSNLSVKRSAMSAEAIEERLAGVPVYALTNASQEFVLVSGMNTSKNLGLFCFSENDADALLKQMESVDPSTSSGSQIVPVALSKVVQLKVDGGGFEIDTRDFSDKKCIEGESLDNERERAGVRDQSFSGVPVFQSKSLILRSQNKRYRPVFFRKEDLEKSLSRASRDQRQLNPSLRGDIQVAVLEDIIQGMKDSSTPSWDDVVFIPPGFDVSTVPSQAR